MPLGRQNVSSGEADIDTFALGWCSVLLEVLHAATDVHSYSYMCFHCILICLFPITPFLFSLRRSAIGSVYVDTYRMCH